MKIIDVVPSRKITEVDSYDSEKRKKQIAKRGYFYDFGVISYDQEWFWNNAEKDIVVAYYEEQFVKIVICKKGKKDYRCFSWVNLLALGLGSYSTFPINLLSLKEAVENVERLKEKANIVDKEEYDRAKRLVILNSIEEQNGD